MSTATAYTVWDSSPTAVFPNPQDRDYFIYNNGSTTVYLDSYPSVLPSTGMPLPPSSSKVWLQGSPCYAIADVGMSGKINVSENAGDVVNPAAVATSLLTSGLAQQIASAIYVTGTPPVDKYTLISDSGIFSGGAGYFSPVINTSGYQSVAVTFSNGFPTKINIGECSITWYSDPAAPVTAIIGYDDLVFGTGSLTQAILPVRGPYYTINVTGATGGGRVITYGSYRSINSAYYNGLGAGAAGNGNVDGSGSQCVQTWSGNIPASTTWTWQPDTVAGRAHLTMRWTTAGTVTMLVRVPTNIYSLTTYLSPGSSIAVVSGQTDQYDLTLPPVPLEISIANISSSATLNMRATLVNERPYV